MECLAMQLGVVVSLDRSGDRVATANTITWRGRGRGVKVKILAWGLSLAQCLCGGDSSRHLLHFSRRFEHLASRQFVTPTARALRTDGILRHSEKVPQL